MKGVVCDVVCKTLASSPRPEGRLKLQSQHFPAWLSSCFELYYSDPGIMVIKTQGGMTKGQFAHEAANKIFWLTVVSYLKTSPIFLLENLCFLVWVKLSKAKAQRFLTCAFRPPLWHCRGIGRLFNLFNYKTRRRATTLLARVLREFTKEHWLLHCQIQHVL